MPDLFTRASGIHFTNGRAYGGGVEVTRDESGRILGFKLIKGDVEVLKDYVFNGKGQVIHAKEGHVGIHYPKPPRREPDGKKQIEAENREFFYNGEMADYEHLTIKKSIIKEN